MKHILIFALMICSAAAIAKQKEKPIIQCTYTDELTGGTIDFLKSELKPPYRISTKTISMQNGGTLHVSLAMNPQNTAAGALSVEYNNAEGKNVLSQLSTFSTRALSYDTRMPGVLSVNCRYPTR